MWQTKGGCKRHCMYACSTADERATLQTGALVAVRLYGTPLPNPPRQCRGPVDDRDCARPALHRSDCAQRAGMRSTSAASRRCSRNRHDPTRPPTIFDAVTCESLRALLHQSPRTFGKPMSRWTLALAAEVSFAQGLTPRLVSDEAIVWPFAGWGWPGARRTLDDQSDPA